MQIKQNSIFLLVFFVVFTYGVAGCSPERRLANLLEKHPHLIKNDTVTVTDTLQLPPIVKDSSFYFYQRDTVIIKERGAVAKYYINRDSTVYLQVKCDSVKVVTVKTKETKTIYASKVKVPSWVYLIFGAAIAFFIAGIILILLSIRK